MTDIVDTEPEDVGTETFEFEAGRWAWRDFVADIVASADERGLEIGFERRPGLLWGLFGVTLVFTVTGPAPRVAEFGEFAEHRAHLMATGSGGLGGGG